jgi:hypothetical protein
MFKWISSHYQYVLFFFISLAPLFWNVGMSIYPFLGGGDFSSPIDISFVLRKYIYTFEPNISGGYENTPYLPLFFPYYLSMWLFSLCKVSSLTGVLIYISFLLFISMCSMFQYLRYVLSEKLRIKGSSLQLWSMLGAGLYGFSPYPIGLMPPGHFHSLVLFALFPLILMYYSQFLEKENISIKNLIFLFILFLGCSGGASNSVGIIYILSIILILYSALIQFFEHYGIKKTFIRLGLVLLTMFLSNAWWLFPFVLGLTQTMSIFNGSPLNNLVGIATMKATIVNIFLGRAEAQLHLSPSDIYYFGWPALAVFIIMIMTTGYALIYQRKYFYVPVCFGMLLFGIFITKGPQKPFGEAFQFLYDHVPGFQIFRRPVNKFYWEFLFFFTVLTIMGGALAEKHITRVRLAVRILGILIFGGGVLWLVYSFIVASGLVPFSIPRYYYDARDFLRQKGTTRILLLPGTFGGHPYFNAAVHGYYGWDFIHELVKVSVISPDPTAYSYDLPNKPVINSLMITMRNSDSLCTQVKRLGISHIIVRRDLLKNTVEDDPDTLVALLDKSDSIQSKNIFGDESTGLVVYSVKPDCKTDLVRTDTNETNANFTYHFINPISVSFRISGIKKAQTISLLQNYSSWWKLYPVPVQANLKEVDFIGMKPIADSFHTKSFGYANSWFVDPYYIKTSYGKNYYEISPDGTLSFTGVLYFQLQFYYYVGIAITVVSLIVFSVLFVMITKKNKKTVW